MLVEAEAPTSRGLPTRSASFPPGALNELRAEPVCLRELNNKGVGGRAQLGTQHLSLLSRQSGGADTLRTLVGPPGSKCTEFFSQDRLTPWETEAWGGQGVWGSPHLPLPGWCQVPCLSDMLHMPQGT